ncbi:helix-turn-helix domain-containing protein [Sporosarcina siberiensis]|uniref:Helix-turn-helix domain-containing protein n=1 Tax=Sporosarcina siberiensis TaxID=1365606 RepID=A0ABW4SH49_9BACL
MNYLTNHQPFQSKHELNEATASHLGRCKYELNETDRDVLLMLSRYAIKYPGVAHLKVATIAKHVDKSERTIQRAIRKLERLQIIEIKPFIRQVSGGFGANLYIFLPSSVVSKAAPRKELTKPTPATDTSNNSKNEPISFISKKDSYIHNTYHQVSVTHYNRFKKFVESFKGKDNQPLVSRLYGVYRAQTLRYLKYDIYKGKSEQFNALSLQALSITFQATKKKNIHNISGYYDGVLRELIGKLLFGNMFMEYDVPVEFNF